MGFSDGIVIVSVLFYNVFSGASSSDGPVHLSNLSCSGFERSMLHCRFSLEATTSSCSAAEDTIWLMCGEYIQGRNEGGWVGTRVRIVSLTGVLCDNLQVLSLMRRREH